MLSVLAISGVAGVGKSTTAYEVSLQLERAGLLHALIDTDELDRMLPPPGDLNRLSERNLAAVWQGFRERGVEHLILVGVHLDSPAELEWICRAVPNAELILVRLVASPATVFDRVERREVGSGRGAQLARTRSQFDLLAGDRRPEISEVVTDGPTVPEVAAALIGLTGWMDD